MQCIFIAHIWIWSAFIIHNIYTYVVHICFCMYSNICNWTFLLRYIFMLILCVHVYEFLIWFVTSISFWYLHKFLNWTNLLLQFCVIHFSLPRNVQGGVHCKFFVNFFLFLFFIVVVYTCIQINVFFVIVIIYTIEAESESVLTFNNFKY